MAHKTITLHLGGDDISAQAFHAKVGHWLAALRKVDRQVSAAQEVPEDESDPPDTSVRWVIDSLQGGSATVTLRPEPLVPDEDIGDEIIDVVTKGLSLINSTDQLPEPPRFFTFGVLQDLHNLQKSSGEGITAITISSPDDTVTLSSWADVNLGRFVVATHEITGSVEGILQMVSVAQGAKFSVRETTTGRSIHCAVPQERLDEVVPAFRKRVIVYGRLFVNENGDVLRMQMEEIRRLGENLPPIDELVGSIKLTRGRPIRDFLTGLRDAP